jgi:hypothetical protein
MFFIFSIPNLKVEFDVRSHGFDRLSEAFVVRAVAKTVIANNAGIVFSFFRLKAFLEESSSLFISATVFKNAGQTLFDNHALTVKMVVFRQTKRCESKKGLGSDKQAGSSRRDNGRVTRLER